MDHEPLVLVRDRKSFRVCLPGHINAPEGARFSIQAIALDAPFQIKRFPLWGAFALGVVSSLSMVWGFSRPAAAGQEAGDLSKAAIVQSRPPGAYALDVVGAPRGTYYGQCPTIYKLR
jgi:hypothetical protein